MHTTTVRPSQRLPLHRPWWVRAWGGLATVWAWTLKRSRTRPAVPPEAPDLHELAPLDMRLRCDIGLCAGHPSTRTPPSAQAWSQAHLDRVRW